MGHQRTGGKRGIGRNTLGWDHKSPLPYLEYEDRVRDGAPRGLTGKQRTDLAFKERVAKSRDAKKASSLLSDVQSSRPMKPPIRGAK